MREGDDALFTVARFDPAEPVHRDAPPLMGIEGYGERHAPRDVPRDTKSAKKLQLSTAAELQKKVFPPIKYVVPGLIVEGCTLLAGRPKLGKSWLVLDIGLAVPLVASCLATRGASRVTRSASVWRITSVD